MITTMLTTTKTFELTLEHRWYVRHGGYGHICVKELQRLFRFPRKMPSVIWVTVSRNRFADSYSARWTDCGVILDGKNYEITSETRHPLYFVLRGPSPFYFKIEYE